MDVRDSMDLQSNCFRVVLTLSIEESGRLWDAAVARALGGGTGLTIEDVIATIGPREDPSLGECLAMLAVPPAIPGCTLQQATIERASTAQLIELPLRAGAR